MQISAVYATSGADSDVQNMFAVRQSKKFFLCSERSDVKTESKFAKGASNFQI